MTRYGIIITAKGRTLSVRIPDRSTQQQREKEYNKLIPNGEYVEAALFSMEGDEVLSESITHIPEPIRINKLDYR